MRIKNFLPNNLNILKMKKLKLKALQLGASELLKREQLKNIIGGNDYYGAGDIPKDACNCNSKDDCGKDQTCGSDCERGDTGKYGHCIR